MECREAQSLIQDYIRENMAEKKMMEFIQHIRTCRTCYHELETYFMIHFAIKYLDEDQHAGYNFQHMLIEDLNKKEQQIKNNRSIRISVIVNVVVFIVLILFVVFYLLLPEEQNFVMYIMKQLEQFFTFS